MKKIIVLLLCMMVIFVFCSCGSKKSYEQAKADADLKLEELTKEKFNGYEYFGTESISQEDYCFVMVETTGQELMQTKSIVDSAVRQAYQEIKNCFKGKNVNINIVVKADEETVLYTYSENELAALKE